MWNWTLSIIFYTKWLLFFSFCKWKFDKKKSATIADFCYALLWNVFQLFVFQEFHRKKVKGIIFYRGLALKGQTVVGTGYVNNADPGFIFIADSDAATGTISASPRF